MADEDRVFDVTKPKHISPSATSRPVIVGHRPLVSDPMVRDSGSSTMKINVNAAEEEETQEPDLSLSTSAPAIIEPTHHNDPAPKPIPYYEGPAVVSMNEESPPTPTAVDLPDFGPLPNPAPPAAHSHNDTLPQTPHGGHIEGLRIGQPKKRRKTPLVILMALVALALIYLGLDAAGVGVPYHIIKKNQPAATTADNAPSSNQQPVQTTPSIPSGFKQYKLADTDVTFAAPGAWGDPTSTIDPGYSKRGGTNQSDGTYAYLVEFSGNKDIEIAVTSNKYLPTIRQPLYYDYLQWCTGTNDDKYYESILHYTTADKVDTPTTITCDQGPVAAALKIDSTTIVQAKATDSQNKVIGDIYSKNMTDPVWVVFRVKDAAMTNGEQIKQLLDTVKSGS